MLNFNHLSIIPFDLKYAKETISMWRDSKENAIRQEDEDTFESHLSYLIEVMAEEENVFLVIYLPKDQVIGLLSMKGDHISQLYLHLDYQRQGIGSLLLEFAKSMSPERLSLYTLDCNTVAKAFYEKHGFKTVKRGIAAQERLPDLYYVWEREKAH